MHSIKVNFDKILCILKDVLGDALPISGDLLPLRPGPKPKFTDIEVIALSLTAESMQLDSELYLFGMLTTTYKKDFPHLLSRRQYNDRRKSLRDFIEKIGMKLSSKVNKNNAVLIVDSMPLEICKLSRMERNKMGKKNIDNAPSKGYCASQKKYYYGYKLHALCSPEVVFADLKLTRASIHDIRYLKDDISKKFKDCMIIGDMGYISQKLKYELQEKSKINLQTPSRSNQKIQHPFPPALRRIRKRIETVFSQLCDQFMIQRNYAKDFDGFLTRILSKITSRTILQYMNKFIHNKPLGKVKYSLR